MVSERQEEAGLQLEWAGMAFGRTRVPSFVAGRGKERKEWMHARMLHLEGKSLSSVCARVREVMDKSVGCK